MRIPRTPLALLALFLLAACGQQGGAPQVQPSVSATPTTTYDQVLSFGSSGSGDGEFNLTSNIGVDKSGSIYVLDFGGRVQKFDANGTFITKWGSNGSADGQLSGPWGLGIDNDGNVVVADWSNSRIQKFDAIGTFLGKWGSAGSGDGQFSGPWGVAFDNTGAVYVVDANNNRVQKFASDGSFITAWGTGGSGNGQFNYPSEIAIDSQNNVYVVNNSQNRVQKFTSSGVFLSKWGTGGSGPGEFLGPWGITVDADDNVYVADTSNNRIQVFTSAGDYITEITTPSAEESQFNGPLAVEVDAEGRVYVVDLNSPRVHVFAPDDAPASDTYTVDFETAALNKILYSVKVGQGVTYSGTGTAVSDPIRVDGYQYQNGKRLGGNQVKVITVSGDKVLTVVKAGTNTPNPTGGELDIKPSQGFGGPSLGKNGLVTLKSITVDGVSTNGAKLVLYGNGQPIKTLTLAKTPSQTLTLDEPNVGFIQVRANDSFTVDDVVFEINPPN